MRTRYITLQSKIQSPLQQDNAGRKHIQQATVESTLGRFLFNEILPQDLGFVDRSIPGNELAS